MNRNHKLFGAGLAVLVTMGMIGGGAVAASAATPDETAAWITDVTLENLGVTVESDELAEALRDSIETAIAGELISVTVEDIAEDVIDDPDAVAEEDIDRALNDEFEEQQGSWGDTRAQWHIAFDAIHADFAECRKASGAGSDTCAHEFRYAMQVNNVSAWLAHHEARLARTAPSGDVPQTLKNESSIAEKLESFYERGMARLEKAASHLERKTSQVVETDIRHATGADAKLADKPDPADKTAKTNEADPADKPAKTNRSDQADKAPKDGNAAKSDRADKPEKVTPVNPSKADAEPRGNDKPGAKDTSGE